VTSPASTTGPPDNCPRCMTVTCVPLRMRPADGWEGIIADYQCTGCSHSWWTSWSTYDLDLPPGLLTATRVQGDPAPGAVA